MQEELAVNDALISNQPISSIVIGRPCVDYIGLKEGTTLFLKVYGLELHPRV